MNLLDEVDKIKKAIYVLKNGSLKNNQQKALEVYVKGNLDNFKEKAGQNSSYTKAIKTLRKSYKEYEISKENNKGINV